MEHNFSSLKQQLLEFASKKGHTVTRDLLNKFGGERLPDLKVSDMAALSEAMTNAMKHNGGR